MRPVWAEVDLEAIDYNIKEIKKNLASNVKVCAVVKADAYGHGAVKCAEVAIKAGADILAIAILDEAVELRENGIKAPILALGYISYEEYDLAIKNDITFTIYSKEAAIALSKATLKANRCVKVHIKIDTGMGRLGVSVKEAGDLAKFISELEGIELEGVFSHFASADEMDESFTFEQLEKFKEALQNIAKKGVNIPIKHIANSAATVRFPETHLDMIRLGILMYGLWPSEEMERNLSFKPAMKLKAKISHLKDVDEGTSISYGRTYITDKKAKIATLPLGYADGFTRRLSGKTSVLINGQLAPLIGRICMDQCMVDVSLIENVKIGDTVLLFGDDKLTADDLANKIGTINYELVCMVGKRVPRKYKR